jgi:preprotein translocase subunit SecD
MTECSLTRRDVLKATGAVATWTGVGSQTSTAETPEEEEEPTPSRVKIIAGFPDNGTLNTTEVLTADDFAGIQSAQPREAGSPPHVPVTLTDSAAQRYTNVMTEGGFTGNEGIGNCFFHEEQHDEPREGEHCLYTVVDGEFVYGASMSPGLAQSIRDGDFIEDPTFQMQTGTVEQAQELEAALHTDNGDTNDSDNEDTNDSDNGDGFGPGFGVGGALAGLGGAGYLLKRRLDDENSE